MAPHLTDEGYVASNFGRHAIRHYLAQQRAKSALYFAKRIGMIVFVVYQHMLHIYLAACRLARVDAACSLVAIDFVSYLICSAVVRESPHIQEGSILIRIITMTLFRSTFRLFILLMPIQEAHQINIIQAFTLFGGCTLIAVSCYGLFRQIWAS